MSASITAYQSVSARNHCHAAIRARSRLSALGLVETLVAGSGGADVFKLRDIRVDLARLGVSFGGVLLSISTLYLWLIHFPLREGHAWAWWTLLGSSTFGFASFLTYLGYGYLDTWHGAATVVLLPCFVLGYALTRETLRQSFQWRMAPWPYAGKHLLTGRWLLLATAFGLICAGGTITVVGMTTVFVPQDLQYMQTTAEELQSLNPRLLPLIAHDRAGFGVGVLNLGLLLFTSIWFSQPSRHFWQAIALAGGIGFVTAIGVHPLVGYNNPVHLPPACLAASLYGVGVILTWPGWRAFGVKTAVPSLR